MHYIYHILYIHTHTRPNNNPLLRARCTWFHFGSPCPTNRCCSLGTPDHEQIQRCESTHTTEISGKADSKATQCIPVEMSCKLSNPNL